MLADTNTFELLDKDPTTTYKRKLISVLSDLKKSGIHKPNNPLRPMVDYTGVDEGHIYQQKFGAVMDSPESPIVFNLYME